MNTVQHMPSLSCESGGLLLLPCTHAGMSGEEGCAGCGTWACVDDNMTKPSSRIEVYGEGGEAQCTTGQALYQRQQYICIRAIKSSQFAKCWSAECDVAGARKLKVINNPINIIDQASYTQ